VKGTHEISKARASASPYWPSIAMASSKLCRARATPLRRTRIEKTATLRLDTLFVAGEVAVVSGRVDEEAAAIAELEINGHHASIDATGSFCANVRLAGEPDLTLSLEMKTGEALTMEIPLRASAGQPQFQSAHARAA
jgi:hypothetical protein